MRIALIKLTALGDVLRTTALLRPLHRAHPSCEIWWFTLSSAAPLLQRNASIHRIIALDATPAESYRSISFDLLLNLDEDARACDLANTLNAFERFGAYRTPDKRLRYTPSSKTWFDMGLLNRDADGSLQTANALKKANTRTYPDILLGLLALPKTPRSETEIMLVPDPEEEAWARRFLKEKGLEGKKPLVGLNTGAGERWPTKQMSVEKTVKLIQTLKENKFPNCLLLGGPEERERNRNILIQAGPGLADAGTNNSLTRFISIVNLCDVVITSDSLAMHMGIALGKKVIAFFGPTSVVEIEFYDRGTAWMPQQPCRCFYLPRCAQRNFCLETLDEDEMTRQLKE